MRSIDKVAAKHELQAAEVPTPDCAAFNALAFRELGAAEALEEIEASLGFPLVIKPAAGAPRSASGSPPPPRRCRRRSSAPSPTTTGCCSSATSRGASSRSPCSAGARCPAVEARPREEDRFNYEARYEIGRTEYICPAELGAAEGPVIEAALRTWDALGFDGFGRVDLMLGDDGPQVLEVNAVPGLTDTSLLPMAAEAAGLSFEQLCARIIELALERAGVGSLDVPS